VRVLILHSRYLSGPVSGENRVVEDESRLLLDAGHDVLVWEPEPHVSGGLDGLRAGMSAVWSASAAARVRRMIRRNGIEVVHVHNMLPMLSPAVLRAARDEGAAVLLTLHNYRLMCLPADLLRDGQVCEACVGHLPWRGVGYRCYRGSALGSGALAASLGVHRVVGTLSAVTRFLAVSEFVRRKHIEAGIPAERISVKPNFTWPVPPREGSGDYFLFVGRLAGEKGVDTLLQAWSALGSSARLVVVGEGPEGDRLRRSAPDGVEFRGRVPAGEVPAVLAGARALLVPSRWYEAAPRIIVEAYAAGVPVVASRFGALLEIVEDDVSGYLVPPGDAAGWAQRIRALEDDATSERLGEGARALWAERYSPERGLEGLERAYREAVAVRT
jgi:glycosyltransferase involved in cell wall biosynthesis